MESFKNNSQKGIKSISFKKRKKNIMRKEILSNTSAHEYVNELSNGY